MLIRHVYFYSTSASTVARDLFKLVFTTEELVSHTLGGIRCPAMPIDSEVLPPIDPIKKGAIFSKEIDHSYYL